MAVLAVEQMFERIEAVIGAGSPGIECAIVVLKLSVLGA